MSLIYVLKYFVHTAGPQSLITVSVYIYAETNKPFPNNQSGGFVHAWLYSLKNVTKCAAQCAQNPFKFSTRMSVDLKALMNLAKISETRVQLFHTCVLSEMLPF